MFKNGRGNYSFSEFGARNDESPVFKLLNRHLEGGQVYLELQVMEVMYPNPVYGKENKHQAQLFAIEDKLAVVRQTDKTLTFAMNSSYRVEYVDLLEVKEISHLDVQPFVTVFCHVEEQCTGQFILDNQGEGDVKKTAQASSSKVEEASDLKFFLTRSCKYGKVELIHQTGTYTYVSESEVAIKDSFSITVWDGKGAHATQVVTVRCETRPVVQPVTVTNESVPVEILNLTEVNICNSPTVRLEEPVKMKVVNIPRVRVDHPLAVYGSVHLAEDTTVSISGLSLIDGVAVVAGMMDLVPDAVVGITGTPTVKLDHPIEVEVRGIPTVKLDQPIQVEMTSAEFTSISLTAFSVNTTSGNYYVTPVVDVSLYDWFSYAIYSEEGNFGSYNMEVSRQDAVRNEERFFVSKSLTTINVAENEVVRACFKEEPKLKYSRLALNIIGLTTGMVSLEIYFQGKR